MLKRFTSAAFLAVVCLTNMAALCCRPTEPGDLPANYDVLAQDQGYWEWERNVTEGPVVSPATTGFSRQLVFGADGQLIIRHNGQAHSQVSYQLSTGTFPRCGTPQPVLPLVTFAPEPQVPNNERKSYTVDITATGRTLSLVGEDACTDGGYYESYTWHEE